MKSIKTWKVGLIVLTVYLAACASSAVAEDWTEYGQNDLHRKVDTTYNNVCYYLEDQSHGFGSVFCLHSDTFTK